MHARGGERALLRDTSTRGPGFPRPRSHVVWAMAGWLLRGCGRAAGWVLVPRSLPAAPGPCLRCGCGEAAALRAMGFSEEQVRRLLGLQAPLGPQRREAAAAQLLLLGLSAEAALALLERSPALLRMPTERLQERAADLRRLGLDGGRAAGRGGCGAAVPGPLTPVLAGQLQRALGRCPQLFSAPRRRMAAAVRLLRERCLFTAEQLREVLGTCPAVLLEEPRRLHHHFQVRGPATRGDAVPEAPPGPGAQRGAGGAVRGRGCA